MKGIIEEYGFSLFSLMIVCFFIETGHILSKLLTQLSQMHMEGLLG